MPKNNATPRVIRRPAGTDAPLIEAGQKVFLDGKIVEIERRVGPATVRVLDFSTGSYLDVALHRVTPVPAPVREPNADAVDPQEWRRATDLHLDLQRYVSLRTIPMAVTAALAQAHEVTTRTIRRYVANLRRDPRSSALVRDKRGRPKGLRMLDERTEEVISHVIARHYSRRERITKQEAIDRVVAMCSRLNLSPPSARTIRSRLLAAEGYELSVKRQGAKRARQRHEPRLGAAGIERPLAVVQIDHTQADVQLLSDDRLTIIGRPWLTLAIDVASRVVVGYYLSMNRPDTVAVSMCLSHAILPKTCHGVDGIEYPVHGLPEKVRADNGKELKSVALTRGCNEHGIRMEWRPVGKAHYGGHIERLNGTLMKMVHSLPGTTFSNVAQRGDYPSEARAVLTLEEFQQWFNHQICFRYHVRVHRALGVPPLVAWNRFWEEQAAIGQFPRVPLHAEMLYVDFLPVCTRTITRSGVQVDHGRYWHEELSGWVGETVSVRSDPRDPSRIWVTTPEGARVNALLLAADDRQPSMDALEAARMAALKARAFEASDAIVDEAARARNRARRAAKSPPRPTGSATEADPAETPEAGPEWTAAEIRASLSKRMRVESDDA